MNGPSSDADVPTLADRDGIEIHFSSYGLNLAVWFDSRVLDYAQPEDLLSVLPPSARRRRSEPVDARFSAVWRTAEESPIGTTGFHLYVDDAFAGLGAPRNQLEHLLHILESRIHRYVAAHARQHVFLHAGVVGWNDSALVLPGHSGSGKSTLIWELVQAGASYYSDEYAVIDAQGLVRPFPRRLTMRDKASITGSRVDLGRHVPPGNLETIRLPIGLVAFMRYVDGASWQATELASTPALLALCEHALGLHHQPRRSIDTLRRVVSTTRVIQSDRGAARSAAWNVLEALASSMKPN